MTKMIRHLVPRADVWESRYRQMLRTAGVSSGQSSGYISDSGRDWYWFSPELFATIPTFDNLERLWESHSQDEIRIYFAEPRKLGFEEIDTKSWVSESWQPYVKELRDCFDQFFHPRPPGPVQFVALDRGTVHPDPKDTGALRIVLNGRARNSSQSDAMSAGDHCLATPSEGVKGKCVYRHGCAVGYVVEEHTVLILPDILWTTKYPEGRRALLRSLMETVGKVYVEESRRAVNARCDAPISYPNAAAPLITVQVKGIRVTRTMIVDVPNDLPISGILRHFAGLDDLMAKHSWVRVNGKEAKTHDVPRHGDTILIEA